MKALKILFLVLSVILFSSISKSYAQNSIPKKTVLTNCVVIDCTGNPPMEDMTVIIAGNTIKEIRQGLYHPSPDEKNIRMIDLKGSYVLPGTVSQKVNVMAADREVFISV